MIIFGAEIAEVSHAFGSLANVKKKLVYKWFQIFMLNMFPKSIKNLIFKSRQKLHVNLFD